MVVLLGVSLLLFWTPLTSEGLIGHPSGDGPRVAYFMKLFYQQAIAEGRWPLWNPYINGGQPFLANAAHGVFYPPNLLFGLMAAERMYNIRFWLHVAFGGLFMFLLCRRLSISSAGSLTAGIVFMMNRFILGYVYGGAGL